MTHVWINRFNGLLFPVTLITLEWLTIKNTSIGFGVLCYVLNTIIRFLLDWAFGYDKNDPTARLNDSFFLIGMVSVLVIMAGMYTGALVLFVGGVLGIACCHWCVTIWKDLPANSRHKL